MFYCDPCADTEGYPKGGPFSKSWGPCEVCQCETECNDIASRYLPDRRSKAEEIAAIQSIKQTIEKRS